MATTVIGSVAINPLLVKQSRVAGQVSFGPVAIPAGYSVFKAIIDLTQIVSLTAIFTLNLQISLDGGITFTDAGGGSIDVSQTTYNLNGGVLTRDSFDPLGPGPVRMAALQIKLPRTELSTRQIQGTIIANESNTAGVTVLAF